jgi:ubiquinone/menaquinone biosynthesis C-methylase UbiE
LIRPYNFCPCTEIDDSDAVDIVGDALQVLKKVPDNAVSKITSYHFLEHVDNLGILLEEIARVLKQDGTLVSVVPHFSNPFFYSDPTHKNFFGLYTFSTMLLAISSPVNFLSIE